MKRETLARLLARAEELIAIGQQHIARQNEIMAESRQAGRGDVTAKALLVLLEEVQARHIEARDRFAREITALD